MANKGWKLVGKPLNDLKKLLQHLYNVLNINCYFACRLFERPKQAFLLEDILKIDNINFHAFKWVLAMHLAELNNGSVRVQDILKLFNNLFPDREKLSKEKKWDLNSINTIDIYAKSQDSYMFPNREEFLSVLPSDINNLRFENIGTYDLASHCPIMSFSR